MGQGRLLGLLPHGSMGYGTADLPPLCPVLPGTRVLQVCSVSVAVLGAELQARGAEPTEVPVVQEQSHHREVPQSCPTSCQPTTSDGWRVSHPARAQHGCTAWGTPARAKGATCTCVFPLCTRPGLLTDSLGTSGVGQGGCSLTAAVDTKEHWRPEWKIRMVLTGFIDLLGIKGSCPGGQCKCPCLQQRYQALQEPLLLLMGLEKMDRQTAGWHVQG